jgi:hypothetical protein
MKQGKPQGKPLPIRLNVPTLVSDVNQTLSSMRDEVLSLKSTLKAVQTLASATSTRLAALTTAPITNAYSATTVYTAGQVVTLNGNIYTCIKTTVGYPPPNVNYWSLITPQPTAANPAFTYTSTSTTITWSWGANTAVYRADGSVVYIGAGSQEITGLSASTQYNFYPIYDETKGILRFITTNDITTQYLSGYEGDGSTGYVKTTSSISNPTNFSIDFWVCGTEAGYQSIMQLSTGQTPGTPSSRSVYVQVGQGIFNITLDLATAGFSSFSGGPASGNSPLDGVLHHIAFTWNNSTFAWAIYLDGVLNTSGTSSHAMASIASQYWKLGWGYNGVTGLYASCFISNVAFYPSTLTAAQVLANYSAGLNIGQATLAASVINNGASYYWELQEKSGTTAADSAGSNTGTYTGTVTLGVSEDTHGAVGSPAIAWLQNTFLAQQAQIIQTNIALSNGPMQVTTPASGSGTPGTGGGRTPGGVQAY